ncbi:MAG: hypothetical protein L0Z62_39025 [Gemmataceae bacterium]|nr:hypothetical protein [Gemmataceae bacterium]
MTEAEWRAGDDMLKMLDYANGWAGNRKLRLFACACCRRFYHLLPTDATRHALETSERAADRLTSFAELAGAKRAIPVLRPRSASEWASNCAHFAATRSAKHAALSAYSTSAEVVRALGTPYKAHQPYYAVLLREILGNPFRPTTPDPTWQTPAVVSFAQAAYEERGLPAGILEPARLAVLADALKGAGCTDRGILSHLRGPGPHVRGCWALDLLLGKE